MPLSFDPDWQKDNYTNPTPTVGVGLITIDNGDYFYPDGTPGDELFVWVASERRPPGTTTPVMFQIAQYDSGFNMTELTIEAYSYDDDAADPPAALWVAHGPRIADLAGIYIIWSVNAGSTAWVLANFPPGTYSLTDQVVYPPPGTPIDEDTIVSDAGSLYAGVIVADDAPLNVNQGASPGEFDYSGNSTAEDIWMQAWAYEGTGHTVEVESGGGYLHLMALYVAGPAGNPWTVGRVSWGARGAWH